MICIGGKKRKPFSPGQSSGSSSEDWPPEIGWKEPALITKADLHMREHSTLLGAVFNVHSAAHSVERYRLRFGGLVNEISTSIANFESFLQNRPIIRTLSPQSEKKKVLTGG
jgi:hypothetical protein